MFILDGEISSFLSSTNYNTWNNISLSSTLSKTIPSSIMFESHCEIAPRRQKLSQHHPINDVQRKKPHLNENEYCKKHKNNISYWFSFVMDHRDVEEIIATISTPTASPNIRSHGQSYKFPSESILSGCYCRSSIDHKTKDCSTISASSLSATPFETTRATTLPMSLPW